MRPQGLVFMGFENQLRAWSSGAQRYGLYPGGEGVGVRQSDSGYITSHYGIVAGGCIQAKAYCDAGTLSQSCGLPPLHMWRIAQSIANPTIPISSERPITLCWGYHVKVMMYGCSPDKKTVFIATDPARHPCNMNGRARYQQPEASLNFLLVHMLP